MFRLFLSIIFSLTLMSFPLTAQEISNSKTQEISFIDAQKKLNAIEQSVTKYTPTKNDSVVIIQELSSLYKVFTAQKQVEQENLKIVQQKLSTLGEVSEGAVEPKELGLKRTQFTKELDGVKANIAKIDLNLNHIDTLNSKIASIRSQELVDTILVQNKSMLSFNELFLSLQQFSSFVCELTVYPVVWFSEQTDAQKNKALDAFFSFLFWALFSFCLAIVVNLFVHKKFGYGMKIEKPLYSQKLKAALFMILARAIIPAAIPIVFLVWHAQNPDFFTGLFGTLLNTCAYYIIYLFLFCGIVTVLFTPYLPEWRLIEIDDVRAKRSCRTLIVSTLVLCFFSFLHVMAVHFKSGEETLYAIKSITNIAKGLCIMLVSYRVLYNCQKPTDEELSNEEMTGLSLSSKIGLFVSFAAFVVICFSIFGYVQLAEFVFNRFLFSVFLTGIGYILTKFILVLFSQLMHQKFWSSKLRLNKHKIAKIEMLFSFFVVPIISLFVLFCLLGVWGMSLDIMVQNIKKFLVGFNIGGMHVSLVSIFLGIFAYIITHYIFKFIKNSIISGKLNLLLDFDEGMSNSIAALVGFLGVIVAFLVGLSVMGGSLKGLAIAAGALSLGAGLGLQNIVNNFVSGIILLFERPVKIGDWVIINGHEGVVKQINMRSTHIETFNKASVIIPNADILSNNLINMTYKNKLSRVDIPVGVGYGSDVDKVKEILIDIAKNTKHVLSVPNPFVVFKSLGESSLDFELRFYISDVNNRLSIQTQILSSIIERFREENIDIPFPQRVIHFEQPVEVILPKQKSKK